MDNNELNTNLAEVGTGLISRQAAIDEIKKIYEWHDNVTKERIIEHFEGLPSAQPDWDEMIVICDCCGHAIHVKRQ